MASADKDKLAQDPFDLVNIIWPTNAQILLYKKISMKTKYEEA